MRLFLFIVFATFLMCIQNLYAQKKCACELYEQFQKNKIEEADIETQLLRSNSNICIEKGYELKANRCIEQNKLEEAKKLLEKAERLLLSSACDEANFLGIYKSWAKYYYTQADFVKAQAYSFKVLHSAELANDIYEQAFSYTMIAQLFNQTGQAEKGVVYTHKATQLLPNVTNDSKKLNLASAISKRYLWHYQDTKNEASLTSSNLYGHQSLSLAKKLNARSFIALAYNNLQGIEYEKGNYNKALLYLDSSLLYVDTNDKSNLAVYYFDKADILIESKQYQQARAAADSALKIYLLIGNNAFIADVYSLKERIAKISDDYKAAYTFSRIAKDITDSIRDVEKTEAVTELEKKYNQAKNENTIKDLDKKKQLYLFLAIVGVLATMIIGIYWRQKNLKQKQTILLTEQRLNRARMNPHFFFNTLTALQKIALQNDDSAGISSHLAKFSHIMRQTLESTYNEYVTVEQELEFLEEYLEVQKVRFPNSFEYTLSADKDIETDELKIPSMIIQPFIENSIEHGLSGINYAGHISVYFAIVKNQLQIVISDNGKGIDESEEVKTKHISRATQIVTDRLYLLNNKLKSNAGFTVEQGKENKGVEVKINLPLIYN